jgi:hypothetical protein
MRTSMHVEGCPMEQENKGDCYGIHDIIQHCQNIKMHFCLCIYDLATLPVAQSIERVKL